LEVYFILISRDIYNKGTERRMTANYQDQVPDNVPLNLSSGSKGVGGNLVYSNSTFTYTFPRNVYIPQGFECCMYAFQTTASWFNISAALGNNTFSYIWNSITYTLTLPDGSYQYSDIGVALQNSLTANGLYLINGNGVNVYYLSFSIQSNLYQAEFTCTPVPSSLPSGYSYPAGSPFNGNLNGYTFQVVIPATPIRTIFGMSAGTQPASATTNVLTYVVSTTVPQISASTQGQVNVNGATNFLSNNLQTIFTFPLTSTPSGSSYVAQIYQPLWYNFASGSYSTLQFFFTDQSGTALSIFDPYQTNFTFVLRKKRILNL